MEFLKDNFYEIGIILGKNLFILIFLIFGFLLIAAFLLKFFYKKKDFYDTFLIAVVGFWLIFKHNTINKFLITIKDNNSFMNLFSSEISLIIIFVFFFYFLIFFY